MFSKKSFFTNFMTASSGNIVCVVLRFISIPFLTRLFSVEQHGTYEIYQNIILVLTLITSGRMEFAIMMEKSSIGKQEVITGIFNNAIFISGLILAFYLLMLPFDISIEGVETYYLLLLPFVLLNHATFNSLIFMYLSDDDYLNVSFKKILYTILDLSFKLILGYLFIQFNGLIFGHVLTTLIMSLVSMYLIIKRDYKFNLISLRKLLDTFKKYKDYTVSGLSSNLIESLNHFLMSIGLLTLFSPIFLGYYAMANRINKLPVYFFGNALSELTFNAAINKNSDHGHVLRLYKKVILRVVACFLVVIIPSWFIPRRLFTFILGEGWGDVAIIFKIILPISMMMVLTNICDRIYILLRRQKISFQFNLMITAFLGGLFIIGSTYNLKAITILICYAMGLILLRSWFVVYSLKLLKNRELA